MPWFTTASRTPAPVAAGVHRSLALRGLVESLHSQSRPVVLDLGPPLSGNLRFLAGLSCRVRVADVHRSLAAEPLESRRPEAMAALWERMLPLAPDERFDAVLAWDAFDYMRKDQVATLLARLAPRFRGNVHALALVSTRQQIPATPLCYRIVDGEHLESERPAGSATIAEPVRPGPRYRQVDLEEVLPGFAVKRCYLLQSGVQEYLLARGC